MEVPELNLRECESIFVRDEFYENIQAPKFHDFCSDEDPVVDADAYFRRVGGRSPRPSTDPFADQNSFKGTKECTVLKPPGLPKAPLSSVTLNTDVTSSVPKASSAGLKKAKPAVPMLATPLTKIQDKAPSKNKMYQRVSPVTNPSLTSTAPDGKGNDSAQAPSSVRLYHVSENTDPKGMSQAKRKVISGGGSKFEEGSVVTLTAGPDSVTASIHTEVLSKVTSEVQVLVKTHSQIRKPSKEKSESAARKVDDTSAVELSDVKDRKRKPIPRIADAGVSKVHDTRSRVVKQQRKSSTFSDSDRVSGMSDLRSSSSQCARTTCSESVGGFTVKPAAGRRTSRRNSDNSRRRRASGGLKPRQGKRILVKGPLSNADALETTGNNSTQVSVPSSMLFGFNVGNQQLPGSEELESVMNGIVPSELISFPASLSPGQIVSSDSSLYNREASSVEDEVSLIPISGQATRYALSENGYSTRQSVQTLPCILDTSDQQEVHDSVGDLLLEKLQKLHLQQDPEVVNGPERSYTPEEIKRSCVINSDDASVVEEVKDDSNTQNNCSKECTEALVPGDNLSISEAGGSTCTGFDVGDNQFGLDASQKFLMPKVVPSVGHEEHDTPDSIRIQDIDLAVEGSPPSMCEDTTVSGEAEVAEIDQADVIDLLQNLQIQSNGSGRAERKLPSHEDAGGAASWKSSLAVKRRHSNTVRVSANDEKMLSVSHTGVPSFEFKTAAGSTQEVETVNETRLLKRRFPKDPSSEANDIKSDLSSSKGPHFFMNNQQKRNNKRKSIELGTHHIEQRLITASVTLNVDELRKAKVTSQSSLAPLTHSQLSSSVSRVPVPFVTSVQHKKIKTTCPQPFRLRTEERGALKEVEFNKKVELYLAAKEKMQNVPFQFTTSKDSRNIERPPRNPFKDVKKTVKQTYQHAQARAGERALFDVKVTHKSTRADEEKQEKEKRMQLIAEEEIKRMRKQMVPHAQRMPFFDRPFKPHRSTKTLTVPSSPKFHSLKTKKSCTQTSTQE